MPNVYIYVVRYDLGFAPNPFHGACTLACCMPVVRRVARIGDYVIGMGGRDLAATGRCIYAMQVSRDLTFNQYWSSPEFRAKRPKRNGSRKAMVGDNIYRFGPDDTWLQEDSVHSQPDGTMDPANTAHDTHTDRVLISDRFIYFGDQAPEVDPKILDELGYRNRRGYRIFSEDGCQDLLEWIYSQVPGHVNRVLGDPFQFRLVSKRFSRAKNRLI